ncbi:LysR family glycine cleavage system transcriptional activator [Mycoplana sp. BE70]|uniref:LysR substrate-binding domain-containing protein n=1 Tax=Mycoplana sp. BE70 TaxID=2817775 RepID=UPI002858E7E2|nr:LysR substrate-binding domain-containing protein [Mycoplana sp. BE70]MDR6759359.1 LysR family glycine cleavage system transcriptional activator [Mycoplana sp. BE70]
MSSARRRLPPLNPLKTFEAVVRHKAISGAAAELHVTQSAVSHQLRILEDSMGMPLLKRSHGRVLPNEAGTLLYSEVSTAFGMIAGAVAKIEKPLSEGDLHLSCTPAFLFYWLIPRLGRIRQSIPGIRVHLAPSNSTPEIYTAGIDIAIRYGDGNWPDCWVHLLSELFLFPVISPSVATSSPLRCAEDLKHHILLHADDGLEWESWFRAVGAGGLLHHQQEYLSDAHIALEATIHGYGVALGDQLNAQGALRSGRLLAPLGLRVPAPKALYIVCRDGIQKTSIAMAFLEWLFAEICEVPSAY